MKKRIIALLLICSLAFCLVACSPTNNGGGGGGGNTTDSSAKLPTVLPDLADYSSQASYYNPGAATYVPADVASSVAKLQEKQTEEKDKHTVGGKLVFDDDVTTPARIFCYADCEEIVETFRLANVDNTKMKATVDYIARADANLPDGQYNFVVGTGSAIEDYEELDELYDLYDNDDDDTEVYDNLQRKKRKVTAELVNIYGNAGDQFARGAAAEIAYAESVVTDVMIPEYNNDNQADISFEDYFRDVIFDYETLVYFLSFNEFTEYSNGQITKKPAITQLYGYYYQYQKADYEVFPRSANGADDDYERYLLLSHKDVLSDSEAKELNSYERKSYTGAYRYSYSFYQKYYGAHFAFQGLQEKYDKTTYVGGNYPSGLTPVNSSNVTYSGEMLKGLEHGFESSMKLSDANYVYTGDDKNVINYNAKNTAWNGLSDAEQNRVVNKIHKVHLERQQLTTQLYAMTFTSRSMTVAESDLSKSLKYQIYSFSGDYARAIQSYKKEDVTLNKELERLNAKGAPQVEIDAKNEEIGRNRAMLINLEENYSGSRIDEQVTQADQEDWPIIKQNIKDAIGTDAQYDSYHKSHQGGRDIKVDKYFEDILIKKNYSCGGTYDNCEASDGTHAKCTEEYDTEHRLSRLIDNHDVVFRHAYGQIEVQYKDVQFNTVRIANVSAAYIKGNNYAGAQSENGSYNGSGVLPKNVVTQPTFNAKAFETKTYETDEAVTLAIYSSNKWEGITVENTEYSLVISELINPNTPASGNKNYTYHFEFIGYYVDKDMKWAAISGEKYDYDIRLYAGYRITKVETPV